MTKSIHEFPDASQSAALAIRVERIIPLVGSNLKAFVSVAIGEKFKIHGVRIIQQPAQKVWVQLPQQERTGSDGKKRFFPVLELPERVVDAISKAVLAAWSQLLNQAPCPDSTPARGSEWTR